jgi:hypothetical protein
MASASQNSRRQGVVPTMWRAADRADAEQQFDLVERGTVGIGRIVQHVEHDDALAGIRLNRNRTRPWRHVRGRAVHPGAAAKASQ